jgi:phenylacetate-coenzyme A ligase PaaK-like adenylate-forming protein
MASDGYHYHVHPNGDASVFPQDARFEAYLRAYLEFIRRSSPHYDELITGTGYDLKRQPGEVFDTLPYTTKQTYREILRDEALRDVEGAPFVTDFSSGSVANPVIRLCRANDDLSEQETTEIVFRRIGMGPGDRLVCIDVGAANIYDFYFRAARNLGVSEAAFLHLTSEVQDSVLPLRALCPSILLTLPSLLIRMWPHIQGYWSASECPINALISMGEPLDASFRELVERRLNCKVYSFYGTTETGGLAGECDYQNGHHFDPYLVMPSIKSPEKLDADTVVGEVVYTTFNVQTQSVIKYEVGDVVRLSLAVCPCGEPTPRLWQLRRTTEDFVLAGDKFSYSMFLDAFRQEVPEVGMLSIEIQEAVARKGTVLLVFHFPDHLESREPEFLDVLRNGIFELDSLHRYGFVDFEIRFKPVSEFGARKTQRLRDHRVELR